MGLCIENRGFLKNQVYLSIDRVELTFEMPMSEIVFEFYDKLKSISKGYASFDYHIIGYQPGDLVKLDIKLNGDNVDAFTAMIHRDKAYYFGRRLCEKLKELIPRQQFMIAIQAQSVKRLLHEKRFLHCEKTLPQNAMVEILPESVSFLKNRKRVRKKCANLVK